MSSGGGDNDDGFIAKLRGLPWSATQDDILSFFTDSFANCKILGGKSGIHMTTSREGRPSGEAFVEFETADDLEMALQKDREHIGNRYIEVFKVNKAEMEWVIKRSGPTYGLNEDGCVRLRGLPFGCSKEEIAQFFTGLEIVPNGITLLTDYSGRSSGEAYVQFVNREVAEKALQKHRETIGHRYIEIFRSSLSEVDSVVNYQGNSMGPPGRRMGPGSGMYSSRPSPYDRDPRYGGGGTRLGGARGARSYKDYSSYDRPSPWGSNQRNGNNMGSRNWDSWGGGGGSSGMHCVHMRGLPFKATENDIADFFKPVMPVNIRLIQDSSGRASGEADVEFDSHEDAVRAMSKDKGHMQHRYIELFLNSAGGQSNGGFGYGMSSNSRLYRKI
ncbi:heterogeneous nuclear ribonucleoprotein H-like [Diorhabda carinulata]|uniref:heterogeneous nuclear ribonucleoprotein H-like n=1 Tax=Diorhabda sublineata TaxID=1163346 RepID=UPI0024E08281|nr:heterogeneous nuclear ribonucleoprotein H-like [Diorhabda sublineata]XP_057661107.1 heterogeneous nuclear ribonucleoprotein H-like [Diorhabda carinulata]